MARRSALVLAVALLAGCSGDAADAERGAAEPAPGFPNLEPFVSSRMWGVFRARGPRATLEELRQLRTLIAMEQEDYTVDAGDGPDARLEPPVPSETRMRAKVVPFLMAQLKPLWERADWTPDELELARECARFFAEIGAPKVSFREAASRDNHRSLVALGTWFSGYVSRPAGYAAMIFTLDNGPMAGLPLPPDARVEVVDEQAFGDQGFAVRLGRLGDGEEPWVLRGVKHDRVLWSRVASGQPFDVIGSLAFADREPTRLGPYGWMLHLIAGGELCDLYVGPDGGFLFYFFSW
jgi:hypothetical protein